MYRKSIAACASLLLILALIISLGGCSGGGQAGKTGASKEISLSFLRIGNDEAERNFWNEIIKSFEAENPGVKVAYDEAAIGDDMDTKLTSLFVANDGPDIIGHGIMSVASRAENGHYTKITDYYNGWDGKNDIFPQLISLGTYKGDIYGIAYQPTPYVFAYRTDLLEQAGYSKPPETWTELAEYARALTIKENGAIKQAGFAFPSAAGNFVEYDVFAFGNGGGFYDKDGNPTLDTPENLEAMKYVGDLIKDVSLEYNSNETNPFMTGNAAMTLIDNVKLTPMFSMDEYKGKVGISLPPSNTGKKQMTFSGCRLLFIGKDCKERDAAFKFIEYSVSAANVEKRAADLNVPVVRASLVDMFSKNDEYNAVRAACVENGIGMPITTWSSMFQRVRNEAVQRVLNGDDPAVALTEASEKLAQEIAEAK